MVFEVEDSYTFFRPSESNHNCNNQPPGHEGTDLSSDILHGEAIFISEFLFRLYWPSFQASGGADPSSPENLTVAHT